jgi:hypothetical protein
MEFDKFAGSEFERRSAAKAALKGRKTGSLKYKFAGSEFERRSAAKAALQGRGAGSPA